MDNMLASDILHPIRLITRRDEQLEDIDFMLSSVKSEQQETPKRNRLLQ